MSLIRWIPVFALVAALAVPAGRAHAQQEVEAPRSGRGASLEFSYGWDGGFARGPDGKLQVRGYPAVRSVAAGSPAAQAGLRAGDVIVSVNGRDGRNPPLFEDARVGVPLVLRVRRGNGEREITFRPRVAPAAAAARGQR